MKLSNFLFGDDEEEIVETTIKENSNKIILVEPFELADASKVINYLRLEKPVIVNLVALNTKNKDVSQRIFDMICGAAYYGDCSINNITDNVYLFSPKCFAVESRITNTEG